jgi:hypothetical protein
MNIYTLPVWVVFALAFLVVLVAIEAGFRMGHVAHRRSEDEKESPVGAIAGSILGLLAFMLAFTFGLVSERYDARKALVREEANAIRTAYFRADFLPAADRAEGKDLLRRYVDERIAAIRSGEMGQVKAAIAGAEAIQRRLWERAVANARLDMNSDVAALYIESVNDLMGFHATRVAVGAARIPEGIWHALGILVVLGMLAVGYQTGIAGSRRSWSMPILAFSFSLVIALISALDRPFSDLLEVSQQPLANVRAAMEAPAPAGETPITGNGAP